ncbi:hypothetical protein KZP23_19070 [Echinicola marina]|uniref:hypothetical protein n=1 Tax=Echinicola marina TaxID=2859768 RepID=UPI001CF68531|nr:hypothetical protein [Echinicola marina]UCS92756.1 hypothetical protein KZP23_19070 [Echinicola marina]
MQTKDIIQLLEIAPQMPVKIEYLPGLIAKNYLNLGKVEIFKEELTGKKYMQIHIFEDGDPICALNTKDLYQVLNEFHRQHPHEIVNEIRVVFGNHFFQKAALDIYEVEIHEKTLNLKLFTIKQPKSKKSPIKRIHSDKKTSNRLHSFLKRIAYPLKLAFNSFEIR